MVNLSKLNCVGPAVFLSLSRSCSHVYYYLLETSSLLAVQTPYLSSLPPTLVPSLSQSSLLALHHYPKLNLFFFFIWMQFLCNLTESYVFIYHL